MTEHEFPARVVWTGNLGRGTTNYHAYQRTWSVATPGKSEIQCSNDPLLGGDPALHNPEDLLIATVSACHMLWYLHLASKAKIIVTSYVDDPVGIGETEANGTGRFVRAVLRPRIDVVEGADLAKAEALHHDVHRYCFIARSVNFPITYEPRFQFVPPLPSDG